MLIDVNVTSSVLFEQIVGGDCFLHGGHAYIKMSEFINLAKEQVGVDGSTQDIGGYNCTRLNDGRPGSFKRDTRVTSRRLKANLV